MIFKVEYIADHCLFLIFNDSFFLTQINQRLKFLFSDSGQVIIVFAAQQPQKDWQSA